MNEYMRKQAEGMRNMTEKEQAAHLARGTAQAPPKTREQELEDARQMANVYQPAESTEPVREGDDHG